MNGYVAGCRDVQDRPVLLAFCQQSDLWSDERCVHELAKLFVHQCITCCCTPVHRYATDQSINYSRTCTNYALFPLRGRVINRLYLVRPGVQLSRLGSSTVPRQAEHTFNIVLCNLITWIVTKPTVPRQKPEVVIA